MAYSKINWANKPSLTKLNADNLNHMDNGIYENDNYVSSLMTAFGLTEDTYSNNSTYALGDLVVHNHTIYECITAVTTAENFDSTKWQIVPLLKFD